MQYVPYWVAGHIVRGVGRVYGKRIAAAAAGVAAYNLWPKRSVKRKAQKMMTPPTLKRSRGDYALTLPDMGTYTNSRYVAKDAGGYQQRASSKITVGRKANPRKRAVKALSAQLLTCIDRFQRLSSPTSVTRSYFCGMSTTGVTPGRTRLLPVYLFDLTSLRVNIQCAGSTTQESFSNPFYRLRQSESATGGSIYAFDRVAGSTPDWSVATNTNPQITSSFTWSRERVPYNTNVSNSPYEKCMLNWADIRLHLTGAQAVPSEFRVSLVRFKEGIVGPTWVRTAADADQTPYDSSSIDASEQTKFWDKFVAPLCQGSMAHAGGTTQSIADADMRVIYSKRIVFNPTMTTETDATGHEHVLKLWYNMDMVGDYTRPDVYDVTNFAGVSGVAGGGITFNNDVNWWELQRQAMSCAPVLRNHGSRVFLLITAKTDCDLDGASETAANHPSFDLMVRRKTTVI